MSALCPGGGRDQASTIASATGRRTLRAHAGALPPDVELVNGAITAAVAGGIPTQVIADRVLRAVEEDRFYVLSDADAWRRSCETRLEDIRLARNPTFAPPV